MARRITLVLIAGLVLAAPAAGDNNEKLGAVQARLAAARAKESRLTRQISDVTSKIRSYDVSTQTSYASSTCA
jgi:hypothetical protein